MLKIDFNQFKIRNPNYRESFEELCYHLFCRKFHLPEGVRSDFNETGLEAKPILHNGIYHGFQSKFFDHKIDGGQIQSSVEKAIKHFKGSLDIIYIYLNIPIGTQAKYVTKIERKAKLSKIRIKWIVPSNFKSLLANPSNLDLAHLYFGQGDEYGFIKSSCDHSVLTFLQSAVHLSLPFKNLPPSKDIAKSIQNNTEKIALVLGQPGSGKTIFMQNLLVEYGGLRKKSAREMRGLIEKSQALPMLINLKDCVHDTIENIIRNRQRDYNIDGRKFKFAYLIDGLDEVNTGKLDHIFSYFSSLLKNDQVKLIVYTCRSGNPHRYLLRSYFPNVKEYEIDLLNEGYIERYFKAKKDKEKINKFSILKKENNDLLREIKDIFLVSLLWDTAETLGPASTFLDIMQHKLDLLLQDPRFKKNIEELNLLDPKKNAMDLLNQELSFEFQKHFQYRFQKKEIQKIILKNFPRVTYQDVNDISNYLCSHYFAPRNVEAKNEESYIYQHRRYQEFYFAKKVKTEYEKNRRILRDNLLSNHDFMESIFLPYLRQQYERDNNLPKIIELNLIDVYMGKHPGYGADDSYYSNASNFVRSIAVQSRGMFDRLLADENLHIKDKIIVNPANIAIFWQNGKIDFSKELLDYFEKELEEAKAKAKKAIKNH